MKSWVLVAQLDPLVEFLIHNLEATTYLTFNLLNLSPAWRNMHTGEARVEKRLDCFLLSKSFLEENLRIMTMGLFKWGHKP
jgi:hypothetical protein